MNESGIDVFIDAFKGARKGVVIVSGVCFALAGLGVAVAVSGETGAGIGLAAGFGALGIALVLFVVLKNPENLPVVKVLRERSNDVVWVYHQRTLVNGRHTGTSFSLGLSDGRKVSTTVQPKWEQAAEQALQSLCRYATFGYDQQLETRFKTDPTSLAAAAGSVP